VFANNRQNFLGGIARSQIQLSLMLSEYAHQIMG